MNLQLVLLCLALQSSLAVKLARTVVIIHPANDEERFQKSIFRALKERGGQFSSKLQIYIHDVPYKSKHPRYTGEEKMTLVVGQNERYSFRTKFGAYAMDEYGRPSTHLYASGREVNNFKGSTTDCLQGMVDEHKFCDSRLFTKTELQHHMARWVPLEILDEDVEYDLLGEYDRM